MTQSPCSVAILGASGAVGQQVVAALRAMPSDVAIRSFGRRSTQPNTDGLTEHIVDVFSSATYQEFLPGSDAAICTFGVGEPSKLDRAEFVRIDKDAVLDFAKSCKESGVRHFQLLSSVAASHESRSFYLRTKGELQNELFALEFERLSLFQPSMILTPANRYGLAQGVTLAIWPLLSHALIGGLKKYRGIPVNSLGSAIANNLFVPGEGLEFLLWPEITRLAAKADE